MISPSSSTINRICPEPECCGPTLNVSVWAPESEVPVDSTVARGTGFGGADTVESVRRESYFLSQWRWSVPVISQKEFLQSRVSVEGYSEHLKALSFKVLDAGPNG